MVSQDSVNIKSESMEGFRCCPCDDELECILQEFPCAKKKQECSLFCPMCKQEDTSFLD